MKNTKIIIKTTSKSYPVYFGNGIINLTGPLIKKNLPEVKKICVISDKKLPSSILLKLTSSLKKFDLKIYKLNANEKNKNLITANKIIQELLKNNFNRSDCIIALGGGIVGDLSAFISNLTKRGLKFINIPTTLLSQADAAIGGKNGVNSNEGKNLIGTFYQPDFVLTDLLTLRSLPYEEVVCGYGEILKHSLILDKKFFLWLCKNGKKIINNRDSKILKKAIIKSCKIKSKIINKDEKEKNLRMILNFGHTFAHGFEATKNYSKKLNHGKAVLLGMIVASELSIKKKLLSFKDFNLIKKHYSDLNLPMNIKENFNRKDIKKIIYFMKKDKKNLNKKINLILLKKIGKTTTPNTFSINHNEIKKFLLKRYY
tara:strand:+ start:558 stop:1670 length:1113 start_codon:yes stop_codon:yes gene_type:complete